MSFSAEVRDFGSQSRQSASRLYCITLVCFCLSKPRPPGIPVREFPGINPPSQKLPAGIPGNF